MVTDPNDDQEQQHQENARNDASQEQVADTGFGENAVEHHDDAGRDENPDGSAGGDHPGRQLVAVSVAPHFRQRDLAHGGGGGERRSRNGAESAAGADGRHAQAAAASAPPGVEGAVQIAAQSGAGCEETHQHEQRDDAEFEVEGGLEDGLPQEREGGVGRDHDQHSEEPGEGHGKSDMHAERQENKHQPGDEQSGKLGAHGSRRRRELVSPDKDRPARWRWSSSPATMVKLHAAMTSATIQTGRPSTWVSFNSRVWSSATTSQLPAHQRRDGQAQDMNGDVDQRLKLPGHYPRQDVDADMALLEGRQANPEKHQQPHQQQDYFDGAGNGPVKDKAAGHVDKRDVHHQGENDRRPDRQNV